MQVDPLAAGEPPPPPSSLGAGKFASFCSTSGAVWLEAEVTRTPEGEYLWWTGGRGEGRGEGGGHSKQNFVAPSSEELWVQKEINQNA